MLADRLPPGTRVRYDYGKFSSNRFGRLQFDPEWATREWAYSRTGTTITPKEHSPYPEGHPWGCPDFATPVRMDDGEKTWVRSSCLDIIGWEQKSPTQPELSLSL